MQLCLKHTSRAVQRQTGSNPCSSSQPASDQEPPTDTIFSARRYASLSEMGWCLSSTLVRLSRPASWYVGGAGLEGGRSCNEGWGCGTAVRYGMNGGAVVSAAEQAGRPPAGLQGGLRTSAECRRLQAPLMLLSSEVGWNPRLARVSLFITAAAPKLRGLLGMLNGRHRWSEAAKSLSFSERQASCPPGMSDVGAKLSSWPLHFISLVPFDIAAILIVGLS